MFATQVNKFFVADFKANSASTSALWKTLAQAEPGFCNRFSAGAFGSTTQLLQLMARYAPQYKRTAATCPDANAKGKGKGKGAGKGSGKSQGTPFANLTIPPCFKDQVGTDMPFVDASELQDGVCGIAQVSHNDADKLMLAFFHNNRSTSPARC